MHKRKYLLIFFIISILAIAGCSKNLIVNMDGMPISNHEYNLTNEETGIRAVFVLCRYFKEYEGKEYVIKPEYLDALEEHRIDPDNTERLVLHIKVVNLNKRFYQFQWKVEEPKGDGGQGRQYAGKLSRKDYNMILPVRVPGDYLYSFALEDAEGNDLFSLPEMGYKVKGGVKEYVR